MREREGRGCVYVCMCERERERERERLGSLEITYVPPDRLKFQNNGNENRSRRGRSRVVFFTRIVYKVHGTLGSK